MTISSNGNGGSDKSSHSEVIQSLTVITSDPTTIHRIGKAMGDLAAKLWADAEDKITSLSINYSITEDEEVEEEL